MVMANTERVSRALDLVSDGLGPACEDSWRGFYGDGWLQQVNSRLRSPQRDPSIGDVSFLLNGIVATWSDVFGHGYGPAVRSLVFEVADVRNRWAHQQLKSLTSDDAARALDSMERVLEAFGNSAERDQIRGLRRDLMRQMFEEESRSERRRTAAQATEGTPQSGLTPWRDIITPHADVAAGRFAQAEYAADLALVADGGAEPEYQDPHSFFARTYITQGLRDLLAGAARRLSGGGGDPVIELQTNFGGGKTHSMIALYHLASGVDADKLPGVADVLAEEGLTLPDEVARAVLVGQMISASAPLRVGGGIRLHTLWGRLAYQLGGKAGYDIVRADDLAGTSPGAALKTLFERFGPAVVLIDEWVAYARQLRDGSDGGVADTGSGVGGGAGTGSGVGGRADTASGDGGVAGPGSGDGGVAGPASGSVGGVAGPGSGDGASGGRSERLAGGDFDTQFTFAQALTEAAAAVPDVVVLISIPASDVEVGGPRGRTALEKLKNVVARKAAQWQPASPDESFEIVRRRLFDPIPAERARVRDGVIRAFCDMYRAQGDAFPPGVGEGEYRRRMELCYPIHPELFDRLFDDWSALDKFQRTRGVLRLMALAISQLWQRDDRSLLIMPGNLPMDFGLLVSEMKKYLEDGWDPVIKSDVDGPNSLPLRIDRGNSHFGRLSAARRAARTVYMGSAPRPDGRRGVDEKSVVLGCAQPGESPRQFADALKRLSGEATHLYVDGSQYWYSLIPNVTRIAADRANSNYTDRDADDEVRARIDAQRDRGAFAAVQTFAEGPGDVPDNDDGVRLVVLAPGATHSPNDANSPAVALAARILAQRDAGPRLNRNLVVFVAAAANRLAELREAARLYLAWKSIVGDRESMNLTPHQQSQAETKQAETSKQVDSLIGETFTLALTPLQQPGDSEIDWQTTRAAAAGDLAARVSRKLASEEKLIDTYSGVRVRMDLDRRGLWSERGDMAVHRLWETYARFPHMPRLAGRDVLHSAISNRASTLSWLQDTFAYAEAHDGERWMGLHTGDAAAAAPSGLLVHPDRVPEAPRQAEPDDDPAGESDQSPGDSGDVTTPPPGPATRQPTQFYAQFNLDPLRCIKQLGEIADNVSSKLGTDVELVLEVRATSDGGFDESTRRTVSENANSLGAQSSEFE